MQCEDKIELRGFKGTFLGEKEREQGRKVGGEGPRHAVVNEGRTGKGRRERTRGTWRNIHPFANGFSLFSSSLLLIRTAKKPLSSGRRDTKLNAAQT